MPNTGRTCDTGLSTDDPVRRRRVLSPGGKPMFQSHASIVRLALLLLLVAAVAAALGGFSWEPDAVTSSFGW